ncbi:MAG TPA: class I SAM-dependent methyltransferase [Patescibacteria group bacterium]|nr:class I SAM-dependent methyltransferase [Patescibacteria group bacterium]
MNQFEDYTKYYDMLYKDKGYGDEADFVAKALRRYNPSGGRKLLSLGCGTCTYELLVAKRGYVVTGIDRSKPMLDSAIEKIKKGHLENKIKVFEKDVRNFAFKQKFDNAMAMFNIAGYITENDDFERMLKNVNRSLKKGGLFVFDCWYYSAVIKDPPYDRVKMVKTKEGVIIRLTRSTLQTAKNTIEINFDVIDEVNGRIINETKESHLMRYWSIPEMKYFMSKAGFSIVNICQFMDLDSEVSDNKWDIFMVARKVK